MPKKPNSHGMQEYVPAGNGDPSGEYADNQGSNRHFTSFKKPGKTGGDTIKVKDETADVKNDIDKKEILKTNKDAENSKKDISESFYNKVSNKNEKSLETSKKIKEETNEEAQKLLSDYFSENEKLKIELGKSGVNWAGRATGYSLIESSYGVHTIRHEIGHTFDAFYGSKLENYDHRYGFSPNLSSHYVDEKEGKTFNQVLHEEIGMHTYEMKLGGRALKTGRDSKNDIRKKIDPILEEYTKYGDAVFDEVTGIKDARQYRSSLIKSNREIEDEALKKWHETDEYISAEKARHNVYQLEAEYSREQYRKGAWQIRYNDSPEIVKARVHYSLLQKKSDAKHDEILNSYNEYNKNAEEIKRLNNIESLKMIKPLDGIGGIAGDIKDYSNVGRTYYVTNGHGANYFMDKFRVNGAAIEIFANMFDIHCSKDYNKKEATKKMLPRTYAVFERIMAKLGKGGGKNV